MTLPQRKYREVVLQLLYSWDLQGEGEPELLVPMVAEELRVARSAVRRACQRVEAIASHCEELDERIRAVCQEYAFERIQRVERSILRLGLYEMLYDSEVPPKVAIAEAMRLSRKFSTAEASRFVNALLDAVYRLVQGEAVDQEEVAQSLQDLERSEEEARKASEES